MGVVTLDRMKTITVSIDDEIYRRSCAKAAEAGTDIGELVRAYLCEYAETPEEQDARLKKGMHAFWEKLDATGGGLRSAETLSREELYDRPARRQEAAEQAGRARREATGR